MPFPEIYVLRHGETLWNREGRMQGGRDSPLTPLGRAQAEAMGRLLAAAGVTAQSHDLLCSPQGRALATAERVLAQYARGGGRIVTDPDLREIAMGLWSGLTRDEIDARWPGPEGEHFLDFYARAPGAEDFAALWQRTGEVLARLTRPTVIVTHGMTSRFLRSRATGLGMDALDRLEGGQGCVHHLRDGVHRTLHPPAAPGPGTGAAARVGGTGRDPSGAP